MFYCQTLHKELKADKVIKRRYYTLQIFTGTFHCYISIFMDHWGD